jgi:arylsulfatase A-like enzyme
MITRRQILAGAASAHVATPLLRGSGRRPGDKPNLLFILPDEWRADTLAVYGNNRYRVPTLNRLASQSIVFDRAYTAQPVCTPNRGTLMTGLWPHTHGCITNGQILRSDVRAFPELLNDSSYRTAYMGKWHLGDEQFPQHGFEEWVSIEDYKNWSPGREKSTRSSYSNFLARLGYKPTHGNTFHRGYTVQLPLEHLKSTFVADEATRFILKNRHQPWILYAGFLEPHAPHHGPFNDLHSESEAPLPANYPGIPVEREPESYLESRKDGHIDHYYNLYKLPGHQAKTSEDLQRLNRNYAGLCSQVDLAVSRILWALEVSGASDNTIIAFTSDHGSMMGSHSLIGKAVLYEESIRVPLFIYAPFRQKSLLRYHHPVSHIDVVPTLLELMGHSPQDSLEGESLLPALSGKKRREDHVFIEWNEPPKGPNARAVITPDGWKLGVYDSGNNILFHRPSDPLEMHNLYYQPTHRETVARLRKKLG